MTFPDSLASCPFCGNFDLEAEQDDGSAEETWVVWCERCNARGPMGETEAEARELWDTRSEE